MGNNTYANKCCKKDIDNSMEIRTLNPMETHPVIINDFDIIKKPEVISDKQGNDTQSRDICVTFVIKK